MRGGLINDAFSIYPFDTTGFEGECSNENMIQMGWALKIKYPDIIWLGDNTNTLTSAEPTGINAL